MEKLNIGEAISTTFSVTKERFLLLWSITFLGAVPNILGQLVWGDIYEAFEFGSGASGLGFVMMLSGILSMVLQGAICFAVYRTLRGEDALFMESLSKGLQRLGTIFLTGILVLLVFAGFGVAATLLTFILGKLNTALMVFFIVACVFFGIVIILKVMLALPACVIEKAGAIASLRRSAELGKGNLVRIFVVLFVLWAIYSILSAILILPLTFMAGSGLIYGLVLVVVSAVQCAAYLLVFVSLPVMYCQLRAIKENYSIADEADVFD